MSYGCVIGRFQVADLTQGHVELLSRVEAENDGGLIILVGVSPAQPTARNPLPYYTRLAMLREAYPHAIIAPVVDHISDTVWSKRVDELLDALAPGQQCLLYGGRDSFAPHYRGGRQVIEVESQHQFGGTEQRKALAEVDIPSSDFRHGMIHAVTNRFPSIMPTVDIGVLKPGGLVLMVGKEGETGWRFPGGFVDIKDTSYELAAKRELKEETGLEIEGGLHYVSSRVIDDWRYHNDSDAKIMTTFFYGFYSWGSAEPKDDISAVEWMPLNFTPRQVDAGIVKAHRPLYYALQETMGMGSD